MPIDIGRTMIRKAARAPHYVQNHSHLESNLAQVVQMYDEAKRRNANEEIVVLNVCFFAYLYNFDLSVLFEESDSAPSDWHERLYARVLALTVYECMDDLPALLGKEFREAVSKWALSPSQLQELDATRKALSAQKENDAAWLYQVRLNAMGHRDHDASEQMRYIRGLDMARVQAAALMLFEWTDRLYSLLLSLLRDETSRRNAGVNERPER